jgi:hypothetical protein
MKLFAVALLLSCAVALCLAQGSCYGMMPPLNTLAPIHSIHKCYLFLLLISLSDPSIDITDTLPGPELLVNGGFEESGNYPWWPSDPEGFAILDYVAGSCGGHAASVCLSLSSSCLSFSYSFIRSTHSTQERDALALMRECIKEYHSAKLLLSVYLFQVRTLPPLFSLLYLTNGFFSLFLLLF